MAHMRPKVAICGSGGLGWYIANAILEAGEWDLVILSTRERLDLIDHGINVKTVDYSNYKTLRDVLRRQAVDTVISVIQDYNVQMTIINACVSAGVTRFVPAEFEGAPSDRAIISNSNAGKLTVLNHLDRLRESGKLEYTAFACGIFMEYFRPGGWRGCGGGGWNDGTFLLDLRHKKACLPVDDRGRLDVPVCLTSATDVGRFVNAALSMDRWPRVMKMYGDRLRLRDMLEIASAVRERQFSTKCLNADDIEYNLANAAERGDEMAEYNLTMMSAIINHEYDLGQRDLNSRFPDIVPVDFDSYLRMYWQPSRH